MPKLLQRVSDRCHKSRDKTQIRQYDFNILSSSGIYRCFCGTLSESHFVIEKGNSQDDKYSFPFVCSDGGRHQRDGGRRIHVGSRRIGVGDRRFDVEGSKIYVGCRKIGVGNRMFDVGVRRIYIGNRRIDVESLNSDVGSLQYDVGSLMIDLDLYRSGPIKSNTRCRVHPKHININYLENKGCIDTLFMYVQCSPKFVALPKSSFIYNNRKKYARSLVNEI